MQLLNLPNDIFSLNFWDIPLKRLDLSAKEDASVKFADSETRILSHQLSHTFE